MTRKWLFIVTLATLLPGTAACARPLDVVASFTILADVVRQVGGEHVIVKSLVPPDGDPHEFEPSPENARTLKAADIAFTSGEGLETWFARLVKASGAKKDPVIVSTGIATITMDEDGRTVTDPHVWNAPLNVAVWTENIRKALETADPDHAAVFRDNAARYTQALKDIDAYAHSRIDPVPAAKRKVLTSHDAFGYFGKAYGVTFLAPLGVSTETEASAKDVAKLIGQIKKEGVKVYFLENSNDPRLVKQVAAASGAVSGGALYVEALSQPSGPAATYLAMVRHNVDLLADAMAR